MPTQAQEQALWNHIHADNYGGKNDIRELTTDFNGPEIFLWRFFRDICVELHELQILVIGDGRDDVVSWARAVEEPIAVWPLEQWTWFEKNEQGSSVLPPLNDPDFTLWHDGINIHGFDWHEQAFYPAHVPCQLLKRFCRDKMELIGNTTDEYEKRYCPECIHVPNGTPRIEDIAEQTVYIELKYPGGGMSHLRYNPLKFGINPHLNGVLSWKSRDEFSFWVSAYVELLRDIPWIGFVAAGEPSVLGVFCHKKNSANLTQMSSGLQKNMTPHFIIRSENDRFVQETHDGPVHVGIFP